MVTAWEKRVQHQMEFLYPKHKNMLTRIDAIIFYHVVSKHFISLDSLCYTNFYFAVLDDVKAIGSYSFISPLLVRGFNYYLYYMLVC